MRLNGWESKALIAGVCLGLIGCTSGNPASQSTQQVQPPSLQQADRHVQSVGIDTLTRAQFDSMLAQLPKAIPADQAGKLLVHLDSSQIANDATYSVQARGGGGGRGGHAGTMGNRGGGERFHGEGRGDFDHFDRFNNFGFFGGLGAFGLYGLYGGYPYLGYPYASYAYYPYGNYLFPYALNGGVYTPYAAGAYNPFMFYNRYSSIYNPFYWMRQGQQTASGTATPETAGTMAAPGQGMPTGFGGY